MVLPRHSAPAAKPAAPAVPAALATPAAPAAPVAARLDVVRRLGDAYAADPGVVGVLCAGSTGRGDADRWSDLELLVLWSAPPSDDQRRSVPDEFDASAVRLFGYEAAEFATADDFWLGGAPGRGLLVEVGHATSDDATAALDRLLVDAVRTRICSQPPRRTHPA